MTAGQAVVWYQGQFQALAFLTVYLKTPYQTAYTILMIALVFGTPLFLFFGWLSDRIGRKPIILGGCALAAIAYVPIYQAMVGNANVVYDAAGKITGANPNILVEAILVWIQVVFVTMVYGPIAAFLVEFFPARVRYTSLSIPYHLGNGEFGGWLPLIYTGIVAATVAGLATSHGSGSLTCVASTRATIQTATSTPAWATQSSSLSSPLSSAGSSFPRHAIGRSGTRSAARQ